MDGQSEWVTPCQHYYVDLTGQCGWPSCIKCGAPCSTETARRALRACCKTLVDDEHAAACLSLDAKQRRSTC